METRRAVDAVARPPEVPAEKEPAMPRITRPLAAVTVVLIFAAGLASAEQPKTYEIVIDRPDRVGDTYEAEVRVTSTGSQSLTVRDQLAQSQKSGKALSLVADGEVLAVDDENEASATRYRVKAASAEVDGKPQAFVEPGDVLEWRLTGEGDQAEQSITVNGESPASPAIEEMLIELIGQGDLDGPDITPEQVFATDKPRAVGETWPINAQLFAEAFREKVPLKPEHVTGEVRLVKVEQVKGVEMLNIVGEVVIDASKIDFADIGGGEMPEGWANSEGSKIELSVNAMVPSDPDRIDGVVLLKMAMDIEVGGPIPEEEGGGKAVVSIEMGEAKLTSISATDGEAAPATDSADTP